MKNLRVLYTGGSGRLGIELQKITDNMGWNFPSHQGMDITDIDSIWKDFKFDLIVHGAAYTDVAGAEKEKELCKEINVHGTKNLLDFFPGIPFVYVSSEYANKPVNYYSITKLMAEQVVEKSKRPYLIIRTLFKPRPYPYNRAFVDQWTQGDYVDVIAPLIIKSIYNWNMKTCMTEYVGTGRKTVYDLAVQTRPDVKKAHVRDVTTVRLPKDYV